jgi:hypothetical protein
MKIENEECDGNGNDENALGRIIGCSETLPVAYI